MSLSDDGSMTPVWTDSQGFDLQEAVDAVFGVAGGELSDLNFSLTIADPSLEDCPLIGCSAGFTKLCGYSMDEIVGRNCRFLVDPVPKELVNNENRMLARDFCIAVANGERFVAPESQKRWSNCMAAEEGVLCMQVNAKKDGTLFPNMFYLQTVDLDGKRYIIGLQVELPAAGLPLDGGRELSLGKLQLYRRACRILAQRTDAVIRVFASLFWYSGPMRRQRLVAEDVGDELDADEEAQEYEHLKAIFELQEKLGRQDDQVDEYNEETVLFWRRWWQATGHSGFPLAAWHLPGAARCLSEDSLGTDTTWDST